MIKLIATDLDGTFLDDQSQFDRERLAKLLPKLREKRIYFVAASGRALSSLEREFAGFEDQMLFLGENGTVVRSKDKIYYEEIMPRELYMRIVRSIKESRFQNADAIHVSGKNGAYGLKSISPEYLAFMKHYYPDLILVDDFEEVEDEIYKVGANFVPEELKAAAEWLTETIPGVVSMTSGFECLDVMLDHVDKGNGLAHLCETLGIQADEVLAFGDNFNDVGMLQFAGKAVVPENAQPEIKALADEIIGDHDTGSVMTYMEEIAC
ncbi:Cof subfamily protein (haloacid dehalogenase superfamily) [Streptococcus gallinaceus]|uniref:HAD family hydrolase n=1 Tax=Streptococcus gallinaceus TaxID=165758 RepID=UPI0020A0F9F5|nr:HAD family hydrolase [Streptococcus gallinaceus]MCP1638626.1 Cof subfamily protein (haloacid dehalogenase superfamily) [Streptococcus gallinaceus]MCP1769287.1 Cof subfamily protein (haloacid dehalogenase superfamily) [Streptococcus gallinaceus]